MNIDKFTQKSIEAVNGCEKLAMEYGNQEIEQEHLLYSLLTLDDSLILKLVEKMEIQKDHFVNRAKQALEKRVKVQGGQPYVGQYLNKVLVSASDEAKQMGDEYVSVEHLFLAMIKNPNKEIAEIWKEYGITRERFLQALSTVRGNQRVTSDNPEATYDTLEKYGQDLVEKARNQKLDPVIGRDSEIRNVVRILSRKTKNNPVLIGEPGVGKTELLKFMTQFITDKAITIEDNPEIHYGEINPGRPYQELKVDEERFSYTAAIKTCLRLNPKWILLSEARSEEVAYLLEAWSTGVSGMTTLHTDSVRKIPDRIVNMIGNEGDTSNIRNTVYEFLNVGILIGRRIDPDTNKRYRYINQMCFFAREFDTVAKVTKNRVYMVVEDGHIVSNTLPADVIKAMKKKYIDNPFKCKEVDAVLEKIKEGGADE